MHALLNHLGIRLKLGVHSVSHSIFIISVNRNKHFTAVLLLPYLVLILDFKFDKNQQTCHYTILLSPLGTNIMACKNNSDMSNPLY